MSKFWQKNKVAISGGIIALIALGGFVGLGYAYSKSDIGYDYVGVGAKVDSLNYNTGTGNMYRITTVLNEGLLTPSTDFGTLQTAITEDLVAGTQETITSNGLVSIQEYEIATKNVLVTYGLDYQTNGSDSELFQSLNDNEKTVVILAAGDDLESENATSQTVLPTTIDEASDWTHLYTATKIVAHARPVTYIGDDASEDVSGSEWAAEGSFATSAYAFGAADAIYVNETQDHFRFRMRDGSLGDGTSTWSTWNDNGTDRTDRVSAADVAFGISRQIPSMYGSSGRYMYTSIGNFVGASEASAADKLLGAYDTERYTNEKGDLNALNDFDEWDAIDAIQYGTPSSTRSTTIIEDETFVDFTSDSTAREAGVIFHDPKGYEDDAVELESTDYSYIDFSTTLSFSSFPTTMASTGFWPINWEWFIKTIGTPDIDGVSKFGTKAEYILSNGAQKVTEFDNLYGYTTVKNDDYYGAELVTSEKTQYRMMSEASTQVAMFENEQATYITGADSNSKTTMDSKVASAWLPEKFTKPSTKYMFFNLGTDRLAYDAPSKNAPYTSDPNFRRAVTYLYDTNTYLQLNSVNTANPISTFEPVGMYTDASGNDLVTYMTDVNFTNQGMGVEGSTTESEQLEYYSYQDRVDRLSEPVDFSTAVDPTTNVELADYYFGIFLNDMKELGITQIGEKNGSDQVITLNFLTSVGASDPFIKAWDQNVAPHKFTDADTGQTYRVEVYPQVVDTTIFFDEFYGANYDLSSISWGPDYLDAWSNIGIFSISENSRGGNSTGGWNMWDGSDYTFDDSVYGAANTAKARELFNDGLVQFYEEETNTETETTANITSVEYVKDETKYEGTTDIDSYTTSDFKGTADLLWNSILTSNGISEWTPGTAVADTNNESNPTTGLDYNGTTEVSVDNRTPSNIIFELLLKDGASTITGTTETGSISPTRALLEGDPVVGYEARTFSFDLTKTSGVWADVKSDLYDELYKG